MLNIKRIQKLFKAVKILNRYGGGGPCNIINAMGVLAPFKAFYVDKIT